MTLFRAHPASDTFAASPMLNKVPAVTLFFWAIKIMSTTVGETAADFLAFDVGFGLTLTCAIMVGLLVAALGMQLVQKAYVPACYWLVVVLVSIVGTLISDMLVDRMGVSLEATTIAFSIGLAVVFGAWYFSERTLSIHTIVTHRRELFYWAAILLTFALGTAAGDLVSESIGLGYAYSALGFGLLIGFVALCHALGANAVLAFWIAYILTRPFGASLGDLLSQEPDAGGLGLGATGVSVLFLVAIFLIVALIGNRRPGADGSGMHRDKVA